MMFVFAQREFDCFIHVNRIVINFLESLNKLSWPPRPACLYQTAAPLHITKLSPSLNIGLLVCFCNIQIRRSVQLKLIDNHTNLVWCHSPKHDLDGETQRQTWKDPGSCCRPWTPTSHTCVTSGSTVCCTKVHRVVCMQILAYV